MTPESKQSARLLIVDDEPANVRLLEELLAQADYTDVRSTSDSREALQLFMEYQPDLLLLDLMMPHLDGFQVMELLKAFIGADSFFPILVLTADPGVQTKRRALQCGATDFLTKPFDIFEALLRIRILLDTRVLHLQLQDQKKALQNQNEALEIRVQERTHQLEEAQLEILERLAQAGEYRDEETGRHTHRVGVASALVADLLGSSPAVVSMIRRAAPLHDVGKIGIPDGLLLKPGSLAPDEFELMKTHTTIGGVMLSGGHSDPVKMAERITITHHERWDGKGYPYQLHGRDIPVEGRIVAVADVFDALTHRRPYKHAWTIAEALDELKRQAGKQFDAEVVECFLTLDHPSFETLP